MQVNLNGLAAGHLDGEQSTKKVSSKPAVNVDPSQDTAALASDTVSISGLAAKAMQSPEIRQEKVDSLRSQISSGQYKIDPGKIAGAILDEKA